MTLEEERIRGEQARRLLADPLLVDAFATVEKTLMDAWKSSADAQERERERLWLMLRLLGAVQGHLRTALETGKLAAVQIATADRRADQARRRATREP